MGTLILALRVGLAAVFATAGVGKLLDRGGSREALAGFGVPEPLQDAMSVGLPMCELGAAAALLVRQAAVWGAVGALVLLLAFVIGISVAIAGGRAPECHCFGQIHSEPAGWSTLVRNGVLAAVAVVIVAAGPGPSINGWVAARSGPELALSAAVVALLAGAGYLVARWLRKRKLDRERALLSRPSGLEPGTVAPDFELHDLDGNSVTLGSITAQGRPIVLVFTHPQCGPCQELAPDLARWQATLAEHLTIWAVSQGDHEDNGAASAQHGLDKVLVESRSDVYDAYAMRGTPSAVVVSAEGRIDSVTAQGAILIEELIRRTVRRAATDGGRIGGPQVPDVSEASRSNATAASLASSRSPLNT